MPQEEELRRVREEIARVKRQIAILPEEKRIPYETRLAALERTEAELADKLSRESLRRLGGEIERLRAEFGIDLEEIRAHIAALTERVEERIRPAEVEEIRLMVDEMRTFHEGLLLPWRREISKELETRRLWADRIERGECELVHRVVGKYAVYESYHHLPTSETWVRSIAVPYG